MAKYIVTGSAIITYSVEVEAKDQALAEELGEKLLRSNEGVEGYFQWEYFDSEEVA